MTRFIPDLLLVVLQTSLPDTPTGIVPRLVVDIFLRFCIAWTVFVEVGDLLDL